MKTTFISTQSIGESTRTAIMRMQNRLSHAQAELSSGKHFDTGLALGAGYANLVDLRQQHELLGALQASNSVIQARSEIAQTTLADLVEDAQDFIGDLIAARQAPSGGKLIQASAEGRLRTLTDHLNTSLNGEFIFSGINVSEPPLADYWSDPPPASRASVSAAFLAEFGLPQDDPGVKAITPGAMETFLDGAFANLFADPSWATNWSSASSDLTVARIGRSETVTATVSANESALRKLAEVYSAAANLGTENLNQATLQMLVDKLVTVTGEAVHELGDLQSMLGLSQERLSNASERATIQRNVLQKSIGELDSVDPFEASNRVTTLLTSIQTSYAVTARIQNLSILNYL